MPSRVTDLDVIDPDVGEPGTSGTIPTGTGVSVRIPPWRFDEYGIDTDHDEAEFWRPEHTLEPFVLSAISKSRYSPSRGGEWPEYAIAGGIRTRIEANLVWLKRRSRRTHQSE